jgi:hypothetical protein
MSREGSPPVSCEPHSAPAHDRLGPDDGYSVQDARTATIEPDEKRAVDPMETRSWRALLQDAELVAQDQDFGFQPPSRLEAIAQHANEQEADCNHSAIMA